MGEQFGRYIEALATQVTRLLVQSYNERETLAAEQGLPI
jgi:hypothetical protein